jgi:hypothetical protein
MIISDRHSYVFVQLPHTGSTAIGAELCEHYGGTRVLYKHSTYEDFLRVATDRERGYFCFSCIRNPMDTVVSLYFRYRSNHRDDFTDPERIGRKSWMLRSLDQHKYRYVHEQGVEFSSFFLRYYRLPYDNWSRLSHHRMDLVLRFESLREDFARLLAALGIEAVCPLPVANATHLRDGDFLSYYDESALARASRVFGPFLKRWGYPKLPDSPGSALSGRLADLEYQALAPARLFYWRHLRYRYLGRPGSVFVPFPGLEAEASSPSPGTVGRHG